MKTRGKRILSLMLCLVLVLALVPMQPIHAYQGSGTEKDPYLVSTYADLRTLLARDGDAYITLSGDITSNDSNNEYNLVVHSGKKVLDLKGWSITRTATTRDYDLFDIQDSADLTFLNSVPNKVSKISIDITGSFGRMLVCWEGGSVNFGSELNDQIEFSCTSRQYDSDERTPEVQIFSKARVYEGITFPAGYCSFSASGFISNVQIHGGTYPNGLSLGYAGKVLLRQATILDHTAGSNFCLMLPNENCLDSESIMLQNGKAVSFEYSNDFCYLRSNNAVTNIIYTGGAIHMADPEDQTVYADGVSSAVFTASGLFATEYEWLIEDELGQVWAWEWVEQHCTAYQDSNKLTIVPNKGDTWLNGKYVVCRYQNSPYQTETWMYSEPAKLTVLYTHPPIDTVIITGLDRPVVGQHPDFTFTIANANELGLQGSVYWVEFSKNGGNGVYMTASDVYKEGYRYNCVLYIDSIAGRSFSWKPVVDDYGDEYDAFDGTLTVCGNSESGYLITGTRLRTTWWHAEPLPADNADCGGDPGRCALSQFKDAPGYSNWAHKGIEYCVVNGLMSGTSATTFSPKTSMSRAMLVTVLYRMAGQPGAGQSKFTDVPANQWYSAAVSWAADKGIVSGVGGGRFDPNGNVTREQIATILFRYASFKGYNTSNRNNLAGFADAGKVGSWFIDGMKWAVAEGLISGTSQNGKTYLSPQGAATREQVAAILMRFCENVAK